MKMMEKKIEDYLHLYLGAPCLWENMDGCGGRDILDITSLYEVEAKNITVKPILRPLESMTEEECWEYQNLFKVFIDGTNDTYINDRLYVIKDIVLEQRNFNAEKVRWALSKHFDLFYLIKDGLAISSNSQRK